MAGSGCEGWGVKVGWRCTEIVWQGGACCSVAVRPIAVSCQPFPHCRAPTRRQHWQHPNLLSSGRTPARGSAALPTANAAAQPSGIQTPVQAITAQQQAGVASHFSSISSSRVPTLSGDPRSSSTCAPVHPRERFWLW